LHNLKWRIKMTNLKELTVKAKIIDAIVKKESDLLLSVDDFKVLEECKVKDFLFVDVSDYDAVLDFEVELDDLDEDKYRLLAPVTIEKDDYSDYEITKVDVIDKKAEKLF